MTHAELETRIGETKTLHEWIAELDLHPTTLNAGTTDETYAYAVCTEDRTYQEKKHNDNPRKSRLEKGKR